MGLLFQTCLCVSLLESAMSSCTASFLPTIPCTELAVGTPREYNPLLHGCARHQIRWEVSLGCCYAFPLLSFHLHRVQFSPSLVPPCACESVTPLFMQSPPPFCHEHSTLSHPSLHPASPSLPRALHLVSLIAPPSFPLAVASAPPCLALPSTSFPPCCSLLLPH